MVRTIGLCLVFAGLAAPQCRRMEDEPYKYTAQKSIAVSMLTAHNQVRARWGVPPLVWSVRLSQSAQQWANVLVRRDDLFHRDNPVYGQNLYRIDGGTVTASQVVKDWADEAKYYNRRTNSCRGRCGHYTQIVWRDTKRVGCAVAHKSGAEVWVCEYDPPGNIMGERPY